METVLEKTHLKLRLESQINSDCIFVACISTKGRSWTKFVITSHVACNVLFCVATSLTFGSKSNLEILNVFLHFDHRVLYILTSVSPFIIYLCHFRTIGWLIHAEVGLHQSPDFIRTFSSTKWGRIKDNLKIVIEQMSWHCRLCHKNKKNATELRWSSALTHQFFFYLN